jgi:hypothetical protein
MILPFFPVRPCKGADAGKKTIMLSLRPGVWNEPFRQVMASIFHARSEATTTFRHGFVLGA